MYSLEALFAVSLMGEEKAIIDTGRSLTHSLDVVCLRSDSHDLVREAKFLLSKISQEQARFSLEVLKDDDRCDERFKIEGTLVCDPSLRYRRFVSSD